MNAFGDIPDWLTALLAVVAALLGLGLLILPFYLNDTLGRWGATYSGKVVEVGHREAHTTYHMTKIGKSQMMMPHHHPEKWLLVVQLDPPEGRSIEIEVDEGEWTKKRDEIEIAIQAYDGRWWGKEQEWRIVA